MASKLYEFEVPDMSDPYDRVEILCALEVLAMSAFFLAGNGEMGLKESVEFDSLTVEEYDPVKVYRESYDDLNEIVDGYNFFISENRIPRPQIQLVADEDRTGMLRDSSDYQVYKVVEREVAV